MRSQSRRFGRLFAVGMLTLALDACPDGDPFDTELDAEVDDDDTPPPADDDDFVPDDDDAATLDDDDTAIADDDDTAIADDDDTAIADDDDTAIADDDDTAIADDDDTAIADDDDSTPASAPNQAPAPPVVSIAPGEPHTVDHLMLELVTPSVDPDGDPVSYVLAWSVDGEPAPSFGDEVDAAATSKHQEWSVEVHATDGELDSDPVVVSVVVANSAPSIASVDVDPDELLRGSTAACVVGAVADADGDPVALSWEWTVDGTPVEADELLDSTPLVRGQEVACAVTATDDEGAATTLQSPTVVVGNTPPLPPELVIAATDGEAGTELLCEVVVEGSDPDGDPLSYVFTWSVDGSPTPYTDAVLPAGVSDFNQQWTCAARSYDGEDVGEAAAPTTFQTCNPRLWFYDLDGDGEGDTFNTVEGCAQPADAVTSPWDCDDGDPTIYRRAGDEASDGIDQDCDGYDCEAGWFGDAYFVACANQSTWEDAHLLCSGMGYQGLAQAGSEDEHAFQAELASGADLGDAAALWLDLSDTAAEGDWRWADGSAVGWAAWAPGQPAASTPDQDCALLVVSGDDEGMWVAGDCTTPIPLGDLGHAGFICEHR